MQNRKLRHWHSNCHMRLQKSVHMAERFPESELFYSLESVFKDGHLNYTSRYNPKQLEFSRTRDSCQRATLAINLQEV